MTSSRQVCLERMNVKTNANSTRDIREDNVSAYASGARLENTSTTTLGVALQNLKRASQLMLFNSAVDR
jgi:hypothetical protein